MTDPEEVLRTSDLAKTRAQYPELDNWRNCESRHQPNYLDSSELASVIENLRQQPPLVFAGEADQIKSLIAKASVGKAFVLQGGDCAETFSSATADSIRNKIRTMLQMAIVLTYGASMPVVKIGRMAGQYAKPRSSSTETRGDKTLPSYLGDAVNSYEFEEDARRHDPNRLLTAYHRSSSTLNLIRAFSYGGFADIRSVHAWNKGFIKNPAYARYEAMAHQIDRAIGFMEAAGVDMDALRTVDFYSSHEALLLEYEDALTRIDHRSGKAYNCSAHFLWIGERTRDPGQAHVEIISKVSNPVGVKLGPTTNVDDILRLLDKLNPNNEPGRISIITRMGADKIRNILPNLVSGVTKENRDVTWMCDPMHGNTITSSSGYKTRRLEQVLDEVRGFFEIHKELGTIPGGLHVELTGDDVTEVLGGAEIVDEANLSERYETVVDPRINHQQALEIAFDIAELLANR